MGDIGNDIYHLDYGLRFRNQGIENKYIKQTNSYFSGSLKFLLGFIPVFLALEQRSIFTILTFCFLFLYNSVYASRLLVFFVTTFTPGCIPVALLADWVVHIYTLRDPKQYTALTIIKLIYWKVCNYPVTTDTLFSSIILIYLTAWHSL